MIVLFTDFGIGSAYIGQMKAAIDQIDPDVKVIELISDAPVFNARAAAYLLAAYVHEFPLDTVFLCVVDPGVGSDRRPLIMRADGQWFVGPDNGLFNAVAMRSQNVKFWEITWQPRVLSATFHGRDLFAPVAARLSQNETPPGQPVENADIIKTDWPQDLMRCIYIDNFGNVITGLRASQLTESDVLSVNSNRLNKSVTFCDVPAGEAMWYENANGLVEIAVNQGNAADELGVRIGDEIMLVR